MSVSSLPRTAPRAQSSSWEARTVDELGSIVGGSTPSRGVPAYWNGDIPWVTPSDITGLDAKFLSHTRERITPAGLASCGARLLPPGTLLVTSRATLGAIAVASGPVATNQGFKSIVCGSNADPNFYYHVFKRGVADLPRRASGTTFLEISAREFARIRLPAPPLADQRSIATILDTLDEAISATRAVIAKLDLARIGLVDKLLTLGIAKDGRLRDPGRHPEQFTDSPLGPIPISWRVSDLTTLATNHDRRRVPLKQADRDKRHGPYPYYGASGVIDWVDDYLFDGDYVLIGEDGENVVSRRLPLAFLVSGRFWANNHAHILEPLPGVDIRFLTELLEATDYAPFVSGSAQPKLTQDALREVAFAIPQPSEQARIAAVLAEHQRLISSEREYLDKLSLVRQGLSDDLLTGRVHPGLDASDGAVAAGNVA